MPLSSLTALTTVLLSSLALSGPAGAESIRVALLPVVVHTSDPESAYVSAGLGDMLSARIERSGEISVLRIADGATTNTPDALLAAQKVGAAYAVYGSFTQFGAGASLDIRCAPVSESPPPSDGASTRHIFIQTGTLQEIIPKLDDLSDKVIRYVVSGAERNVAQPIVTPPDVPLPAAGRNPDDSLAELRSRVEALERTVYSDASELGAEDPSSLAGGALPPMSEAEDLR